METINQSLSVTSLISRSWAVFTQHFRTIAIIVLLIYTPINLLLTFAPGATGEQTDWNSLLAYARFNGLYELLIGSFCFIMVAGLAKAVVGNQPVDFKTLWSTHFNGAIYIRYLWTSFVKGLLAGLLFLLLIVPGIIFSVYWIFAEFIAIYEAEGGMKAMEMSRALVRGKWWRVFWIAVAGFLCSVAVGMAASFGIELFASHWSIALFSSFVNDLCAAFYVIYLSVAYQTLKENSVTKT